MWRLVYIKSMNTPTQSMSDSELRQEIITTDYECRGPAYKSECLNELLSRTERRQELLSIADELTGIVASLDYDPNFGGSTEEEQLLKIIARLRQ